MSAITRGVVAAVLLAGAVAGASAFPRLLAGPGGGQTPTFAVPRAASQPAIVRAPAVPALHVTPVVAPLTAVAAAPVVLRRPPTVVALRPKPPAIVINPATLPPAPAPAAPAPSLTDQLKQLGDLKASGVLSDEEFDAAKQKLLAS